MNRTKLFYKKIYFEGLNQLKSIGLIGLCIITISSMLMSFINIYLNTSSPKHEYFLDYNPILVFIIYVLAPIFTLKLFSFLFSRKASDFYHSLAVKRLPLFISFSAAVMTVIICITVAGILPLLLCAFIAVPGFDYSTVLPTALNIIVGSALMMSGILIGCSLSGRLFSAIIISGVILFYPRYILSIIIGAFRNSVFVADTKYFDIPLGNEYNILTGGLINEYSEYKAVVYSLILAAVYLIFAAVIFKRRKSEFAANTSMGRISQTVFRIIFSMLFFVPASITVYERYFSQYNEINNVYNSFYLNTDASTIIILVFFGLVAYFLFEFITQRSFKTLLRSALELGYVVLLCGMIIGGLALSENYVTSYRPDANEIDSIRFNHEEDYDYLTFYNSEYDTNEFKNTMLIYKTEIKNNEVKQIVCDALKWSLDYYNDYYYTDEYDDYEEHTSITVSFKSNSSVKYRQVSFSESQIKKISEILTNDKEFQKKYASAYPESLKNIKIESNYLPISLSLKNCDKKQLEDIYNTAKAESKAFDIYTFFSFDQYYYDYEYIIIATDEYGDKYLLPITNDMKKTLKKMYSAFVSLHESSEKTINLMKKSDVSIEVEKHNIDENDDMYYFTLKDGCKDKFIKYIENNSDSDKKNTVIISIWATLEQDDDRIDNQLAFFEIDADKFDEFFETEY